MNDNISIKGTVEFKVYQDGRLIDDFKDNNLILNLGKETICQLIASGNVNKVVTKIGFGESNAATSAGDSSLVNGFVKFLGNVSYPAINQVKWEWTLENTEANGKTIREMALMSANNTLFARRVITDRIKDNTIYIYGTWTLTF